METDYHSECATRKWRVTMPHSSLHSATGTLVIPYNARHLWLCNLLCIHDATAPARSRRPHATTAPHRVKSSLSMSSDQTGCHSAAHRVGRRHQARRHHHQTGWAPRQEAAHAHRPLHQTDSPKRPRAQPRHHQTGLPRPGQRPGPPQLPGRQTGLHMTWRPLVAALDGGHRSVVRSVWIACSTRTGR